MMETVYSILNIIGIVCLVGLVFTGLVVWVGILLYCFVFKENKEDDPASLETTPGQGDTL